MYVYLFLKKKNEKKYAKTHTLSGVQPKLIKIDVLIKSVSFVKMDISQGA
jgi:hypothetical protein